MTDNRDEVGGSVTSLRRRFLAAGVLPFALLLSSCGGSGDAGTSSSTASGASTSSGVLDQVTVQQPSAAAAPTMTLPTTPLQVSSDEHRVVKAGSGETITDQQKLTVNYLLVDGRDGKTRDSAWAAKAPTVSISRVPQFKALVGQKVGARMLIAMPASEALGSTGDEKLDIRPDDTLLYLLEVTKATAPLTSATGTPIPPKAGLPTVTMGKTTKDPATFTVPKTSPPKNTVAQPLIVGDGPKVLAGQTVRVAYTGVTWRDPSKPFDYSGKTEQGYAEFQVGPDAGLIKAWNEHVVGQTVGSRLLLVVPPKDGYGASGMGNDIKGTDTLVFVIDILDAS